MSHADDLPVYEPRVTWEPVSPAAATEPVMPTGSETPAMDKRRKLGLLIAGAFVLVAAVVVTLALTFSGSKQPLTIEYGLMDIGGDSDCSGGDGGYSDIGPGMPVTVSDETGRILASTTLPEEGEGFSGVGCIWTMQVVVDGGAEQYSIEGGRRGAVTYSHAELEQKEWKVSVGVGD
jgi:hypothetical protein